MRALVKITFLFWTTFVLSSATAANFRIAEGRIIDPQGNEFIPVGTNVQGMKWVWPGDVVPQSGLIADAWNFNIIRVNCRMYDSFWNGQNVSANAPYQTIESMQAIVDAFTPLKVVVMFEFHDRTGSYYTNNDLEDLKNSWREICDRWGDNPYVWFNIMNEPGGTNNTVQQWVNMHREVIKVIRDEKKSENMIVVDAHYWGQDVGAWSSALVDENKSSILSGGSDLINFNDKKYENIMFSFHIYDQWNYGSPSQIEYKLHDYFTRVKEKGFALMVGEFGTNSNSGDLYYPEAYKATIKVAAAHGVGLVWWHWYGGDNLKLTTSGNGNGGLINNTSNPTNLTWPGLMFWDYSHHQGNRSPFVTISHPSPGQSLFEGNNLKVAAVAADYDDGIEELRFYINNSLEKVATTLPYEINIANISSGRYHIKAVAKDKAGNETISSELTINVAKQTNRGILLFITDSEELSPADDALFDQMLKSGFRVSNKTQNEVAVNDATNRLGIVISSSVSNSKVGTLFAKSNIPVLVANPALYPAFGMTGTVSGTDFGKLDNQQELAVSGESNHPVTENLTGSITIYKQNATLGFGVPGIHATVLLTTKDDAAKAALFTYSKNVEMFGLVAPSKRAGWFGLANQGVEYTDDALVLFDRILNWMVDQKTSASLWSSTVKEMVTLVKHYPNPAFLQSTVQFFIKEEGLVKLSIINTNGVEIASLLNEHRSAGEHVALFEHNGKFAPGIYLLHLQQNQYIDTLTITIQ